MLTRLHRMGTFKRWGLVVATTLALTAMLTPHAAQAMPIPPVYGGFPVVVDPGIPFSAQTTPLHGWVVGGPPVIHVNPTFWVQIPIRLNPPVWVPTSEAFQVWILERELAHVMLGHMQVISSHLPVVPSAISAKLEWDADTAAAANLTRQGNGAVVEAAAQVYMMTAANGMPVVPQHAAWGVVAQHILAVKRALSPQ